jgi:hypothetical protein
MKRSERSGFTRYKSAPPCLRTGTDREVLAVWVVACVEHARAAAGVRVVKIKDGIVNRKRCSQATALRLGVAG